MAELLLLNPRRRKARRTPSKKGAPRRRAARRRNPSLPAQASSAAASAVRRRVTRRRNPITTFGSSRRVRRSSSRRRRNPISMGGVNARSILSAFKDAAIGGAGSIGMDMLMGRINPYLPASLRTTDTLGVGDAVKAVLTVVLGKALSKPTRGLSQKMAAGALVTQARDILSTFLPAGSQVGYAAPGRVINMSARVGPSTRARASAVGMYAKPGNSPLLNAYLRPGVSPLLNSGRGNAARREGVLYR